MIQDNIIFVASFNLAQKYRIIFFEWRGRAPPVTSLFVGGELSDVSLVDFDRHLIRDFSPGRTTWLLLLLLLLVVVVLISTIAVVCVDTINFRQFRKSYRPGQQLGSLSNSNNKVLFHVIVCNVIISVSLLCRISV